MNREDWKGRAQFHGMAAARLEDIARALMAEAKTLREAEEGCKREARRRPRKAKRKS